MQPFSCTTHKENSVFIVRTAGYLDETGGEVLRKEFETAFPSGFSRYILNLSDASVINSQGITKIIELIEFLVYEGKVKFALVGLSELYLEIFQGLGILKLVKFFPDEPRAIKDL